MRLGGQVYQDALTRRRTKYNLQTCMFRRPTAYASSVQLGTLALPQYIQGRREWGGVGGVTPP